MTRRDGPGSDPLAALAARVMEQPLSRCGASRVLAVDGRSGAGKSYFAAMLADAFGDAPVVHMDDLTPGWDGLETAVDVLLQNVLLPLSVATPVRYRRWDWHHDRWSDEDTELGVPEVLVVEGVGACARAVEHFAMVSFWVEAPDDDRYRRAIDRDGDTFRDQWDRWAAQEEAHYAREGTRERCTHVVDGLRDWSREVSDWP
ncbi:uridine kinase family protein [Pseudonocardia sp. CA-107938]|uniref:uridine kinase family protein n=1 Tax=Pseudonocardia sp. CA-107938 TaxID=3240021 RepID=UPI003D89C3DA